MLQKFSLLFLALFSLQSFARDVSIISDLSRSPSANSPFFYRGESITFTVWCYQGGMALPIQTNYECSLYANIVDASQTNYFTNLVATSILTNGIISWSLTTTDTLLPARSYYFEGRANLSNQFIMTLFKTTLVVKETIGLTNGIYAGPYFDQFLGITSAVIGTNTFTKFFKIGTGSNTSWRYQGGTNYLDSTSSGSSGLTNEPLFEANSNALLSHLLLTNNPHQVTPSQIGAATGTPLYAESDPIATTAGYITTNSADGRYASTSEVTRATLAEGVIQTNLTTHINLNGTNVHGLSDASTQSVATIRTGLASSYDLGLEIQDRVEEYSALNEDIKAAGLAHTNHVDATGSYVHGLGDASVANVADIIANLVTTNAADLRYAILASNNTYAANTTQTVQRITIASTSTNNWTTNIVVQILNGDDANNIGLFATMGTNSADVEPIIGYIRSGTDRDIVIGGRGAGNSPSADVRIIASINRAITFENNSLINGATGTQLTQATVDGSGLGIRTTARAGFPLVVRGDAEIQTNLVVSNQVTCGSMVFGSQTNTSWGLTTNIQVLLLSGITNTLWFTNGLLQSVTDP